MENITNAIQLHDYQEYAKNWIKDHPFCGLFFKMGLGKTLITLAALWELNPQSNVLIIAPKPIARCTWQNEMEKWNMNFRVQSLVVNEKGKDLSKKKREELFDSIPSSPPTVYFINRELVTQLCKRFPGNKWPFKIVVIDESQSFKAYNAERFKALKKVRPYIYRLILLTGSPTPKSLEDIWPQIYLLDMGQRLGKTITEFRNRYFYPGIIQNNYPVTWIPKKGVENEIYSKISDLVISMKNTKISLPPVTYNPVTVVMDEKETKRYKSFMKTNILELEDGTEIEAVNAAVLQNKLSQMASGAIYTDPKTKTFEKIHEKKLELCEYIINNSQGSVIIAYYFHSDKAMLMEYLTAKGINPVVFDGTPEMLDAWNSGKLPVILLQPKSCGLGLNLQDGGSTLIWYTLPWSLEDYEQTNARIYRQGQKNPVIIHQLLTKGTVDHKILHSLNIKDMSQERLIEAVKAAVEFKDL